MKVPTHEELAVPALRALREAGGEASIEEHADTVAAVMRLSEEVLAVPHGGQGARGAEGHVRDSKFNYHLTWVRTYLRKMGAIENKGRGVWSLTDYGWSVDDETALHKFREVFRGRKR
ncbi:MAG: hypothetical protein F4152_03705 [Dehalococcoidia bacterium]|nr:hypothetical protein [Dehalococcoidia bacterium]